MAGVTPSLSWIVDLKKTTHTHFINKQQQRIICFRVNIVFLKDALNGRLYPGDVFSLS